ncbi:Cytochrome P450 3A24 [Trichoplax sp. H2]|nr:Cytochrome P450 3A24 [Trichoplax sp. H2]|eukprot:RDD39473.1 Cytochrome P450 3A24 [Trichoplax sp. H2]
MIGLQLSTSQILLISGTIFAWFFYKAYIKPKRCLKNLGIRGPPPKPILGNLLDCKPALQHIAQIERQEKYGYVYGTLFFSIPTIWIGDVDILKSVLIKDFPNFTNHFGIASNLEPFNKALLELKDSDWKRVRTILVPTFSVSQIKENFSFVDKAGEGIVASLLKAEKEGDSIDLRKVCGNFSMEILLATAAGMEFESKEQEKKLTAAASQVSSGAAGLMQLLLLFATPLFRILEPLSGGQFMNSLHYLTDTCRKVIKERRKKMAEGIACRRDLMQQMIEAGDSDKLDDNEVVAQAVIFLVGGYETTANTLAFATYLLATNPEVQNRLYNEIKTKLSDADPLDYDRVADLPYLEMVILETLRIYPPAFRLTRACKNNTTIDGHQISKEAMIAVPVYAIHHDPKLWPNPEQFIPERFAPEEKSKRAACAYLPFGMGPRNCLGMKFALLKIKLALVKVLQSVELTVTEKTDVPLPIKCGITMAPANGVHLGCKRR